VQDTVSFCTLLRTKTKEEFYVSNLLPSIHVLWLACCVCGGRAGRAVCTVEGLNHFSSWKAWTKPVAFPMNSYPRDLGGGVVTIVQQHIAADVS